MTGNNYEGRSITLRPRQQEDKKWICAYTILEVSPRGSWNSPGYTTGSFSTRDEAEAAALEAAHGEIEAWSPIGEPIN